jgi:hypothetical protein
VAAVALDNGTVLILITLSVLPIAAIAFARSGTAWKQVGKGAFAIEQELPPSRPPETVDRALQEAEARQMLEAKSYRRQQSGGAPIDVEAEIRVLLEPSPSRASVEDALRDEVRGLVIAANERRLRRGQEPLDVEAETERQLAEIA